jgi:soluble lytic murein transglycosylase-like protein
MKVNDWRLAAPALLALGLSACVPTAQVDTTPTGAVAEGPKSALDERIAYYAQTYDVPETLLRRSIKRESGYNPKARNGPYWGLMQIRYDTARGLGYHGPARGLLDADTNLKYAAAYMSNAYRIAGGDENRAMRLYAGGYYYEARRKGMLDQLRKGEDEPSPLLQVVASKSDAP